MKSLAFPVIHRALAGCESLPPRERADLYDGVALCLRAIAPTEANAAELTAKTLREAEQLQLELSLMLKA